MLPGLMMPLLLSPHQLLRLLSWLLRRSWMPQGLSLRLRMWAGLTMPLPHSKFLTCRLTWAAMHSAACFQAVRLSLQGLTQVTWFRSAMLPGLRMPQGL